MNAELTPATIVRELVATEIHRRRLLGMLETAVGRPVLDPGVFRYSHLTTVVDIPGHRREAAFGEGFNLSDEAVEVLLAAAFERGR